MTGSTCFTFRENDVKEKQSVSKSEKTKLFFFFVIFKRCVCLRFFQALRLTQKEQMLEERLQSVCQENTELRASLASLHTRLALHDQLNQQHSQQVLYSNT